MKNLLTIALILCMYTTSAQVTKLIQSAALSKKKSIKDNTPDQNQPITSAPINFISTNLSDNKKVATLRNDTLFVHKRILPFTTIREQIRSKTDTVVYYKNQAIIFKTAVFDYAYFFKGKNGKDFY